MIRNMFPPPKKRNIESFCEFPKLSNDDINIGYVLNLMCLS